MRLMLRAIDCSLELFTAVDDWIAQNWTLKERRQRRARRPAFRGGTVTTIASAFDGLGLICGKLSGKQEANMNWIKCTDMNKQPVYVNIENATSIFWVEQEKASIIGFPSGTTA